MMTKVAGTERGQRDSVGQETNFKATIVYADRCIADCLIKTISGTGMKLFVSKTGWLPQNFHVKIDNDNMLDVKRVSTEKDFVSVDFNFAS